MSREPIEEQTLHEFADGELSDSEMERIEALLEAQEQDQALVAGIDRVGELLRINAREQTNLLDSNKLFADIEAGIEEQKNAGFGDAFRVIEGGGETSAQESRAKNRESGVLEGEQVRPEGWKIVIPVAAGLLAAAVVLLVVLSGNRGVETPLTSADGKPTIEPVIATPAGSEVIDVDFGDNAGTVFEVEGDAGEPLAVVWIEDDVFEDVTQSEIDGEEEGG